MSSDSESVLKSDAINLYMNEKHGIKMSLRIPNEHKKTAERYMRMVREKMEAKLSELPYTLPPGLYDELALDVVMNCNEMPNAHTTPRTPREMVTGEPSISLPTLSHHLAHLSWSSVVIGRRTRTHPIL